MSSYRGLNFANGVGSLHEENCIWFFASKPRILKIGCVAGTYARYDCPFWPSRVTAPMFAPLILTAPLDILKSKCPTRAIVVFLSRLMLSSDSDSLKMSSGLLCQLHSLRLRRLTAGSGSASDSSYSETRSSAGGLDGAASGSRVVCWIVTIFLAASALSLAAAIALSGFSGPAAGPAYLVRMDGTRLDLHSSYFALRRPQSCLPASFS